MLRHLPMFVVLAIAAASVTTATSAWAVPPADAKLAEALFTSGKDAMSRGDLATACARFTESLKLDPAVGTLLNLATCEERSGKLATALEHFTKAKDQLANDDFRIPFASERIASLSQRVAKLVVRSAAGRTPGARITRDDVELEAASIGEPILVDPGAHVVVLEVDGKPERRVEITLREGEEKVVDLEPPPASAPAERPGAGAPPSSEPPREAAGDAGSTKRTLGWITGGIAVAGLATGAVAGIMTMNAASTYDDHCDATGCDPEGLSAASTGRTTRIVSPVGFGVGAAFAAASAYFFLTAPARPSRGALVAPVALTGGGALSVVGRF